MQRSERDVPLLWDGLLIISPAAFPAIAFVLASLVFSSDAAAIVLRKNAAEKGGAAGEYNLRD